MDDIDRIEISWKSSEKGRVCTATAISKKGKALARAHVTLPYELTLEFYRAYVSLADEEIQKAAQVQVKFMIDNPGLFQ